MVKVLHLHTHRDTFDITVEEIERFLSFMMDYDLIYSEDIDIDKGDIDGDFNLGYEILSEEDDLFVEVDITRSACAGKWESFKMYGFPKCFERLNIDLIRLYNFFEEGGWVFRYECSYSTDYEREDDYSVEYIDDMGIDEFRLECTYSISTSTYITFDDDMRKNMVFDLKHILKPEIVSKLSTHLYEYMKEYVEDHLNDR